MTFTISGIKSAVKTTKMEHLGNQRRSMNITQHPRYRRVILRIGEFDDKVRCLNILYTKFNCSWLVLYPIVSLVVNFFIVALDLNSTIRGVNTQLVTQVCYVSYISPTDLSSSHRTSV